MVQLSEILIADIPISIRKSNVKHLRLSVRPPNGRVLLSVPIQVSLAHAIKFAESRLDWIQTAQAKFTKSNPPGTWVWGRLVNVELDPTPGRNQVTFFPNNLVVRLSAGTQLATTIESWRKRELSKAVRELLPHWQTQLDVQASSIVARHMTSRWGSANPKTKRLAFSTELTKKHPRLLEYVVVHELAHLIVANHSSSFWQIMDTHLPNWPQLRAELNYN